MTSFRDLELCFPDRETWTLADVLEKRRESHRDKVFVRAPEEDRTLTFAEMADKAVRIGSGLLERGGRKGDRVLIMAPNCIDYLLMWFGCSVSGLVEFPVNTAYFGAIFDHQLEVSSPKFALVAPEHVETLISSPPAMRDIRHVFVLGEGKESVNAERELQTAGFRAESFAALSSAAVRTLPLSRPFDHTSVLFTSGTTGPSKGVMNSNAQVHFFAEEVINLTLLTEADVFMSVGPLFHANAQFLSVYPALLAGATLILRRKFSASQWSRWLHEDNVTVTNLVGVMMPFIYAQPPSEFDGNHPLRCILTAPTAWPIVNAFKDRFGVECITEDYGSTETALPILTPYGVDRPIGSCGLLLENWFEARLVDPETDEVVQAGQLGELILRPKVPWTTSLGYFGMPEKTAESRRNCWLHTGDALRQDSDGWFYFVDRISDSIRRRGENISSYDVEEAIIGHPDIEECAAIAVPANDLGGEDEVMAVIVLKEGAILDNVDIWAWCDARLPSFARPRYLRIVSKLPRTSSEKVQKASLRKDGIEGADDRELRAPAP